MENENNKKDQDVLYVSACGANACLDIVYIKKIIQLSALKAVPGAPDYLIGMLNYGGKIIPIFDLAMLLGFNRETPYSLDFQIILLTNNETNSGLIVDNIIKQGVINVSSLKFEDELINKNFIYNSVGLEDGNPVFVINMKKIIQDKIELDINVPLLNETTIRVD